MCGCVDVCGGGRREYVLVDVVSDFRRDFEEA